MRPIPLPETATLYSVVPGDDPIGQDPDAPSLLETLPDPSPSPAQRALDRLAVREFWCAVRDALTPREWQAVQWVYIHGLDNPHAGERMGISKERVRQLLEKARGKLYRALAHERLRRTHERLLWD